MSRRDPDAVLAELGDALQGAWADGRRRPRPSVRLRPMLRHPPLRGGRRGLVAAAAATLTLLVPTAIATREAVFAPDPPPALPSGLRPGGSVVPQATGTSVYVGAGRQDDVAWRLSATTCRYGTIEAVGLFLSVPGGGAGARCDVAGDAPGTSPAALAARRVQTYYDPAADVTWAFGALPSGAATVDVVSRAYGGGPTASRRLAAAPVDAHAIEQGHLPAGLRVFVVALPGGRDVARVRVTGSDGAPLLTCVNGRCDR